MSDSSTIVGLEALNREMTSQLVAVMKEMEIIRDTFVMSAGMNDGPTCEALRATYHSQVDVWLDHQASMISVLNRISALKRK